MLEEAEKREMVPISGGTYNQTDGGNQFDHTIPDFTLGKYEVTYELWYIVYQWAVNNDYIFANLGREGNDGTDGTDPTDTAYEPVTCINWRDAIVWCNAYSEMTGLNACYFYSGSVIKDSSDINATACDNAVCIWSNNGYRLPTEGEWQFAASNKGATPYNYASGAAADCDNLTETKKVAWLSLNSGFVTHDVGTTDNSSALTLWDVSGNVWELCWDWYGPYPTTDQIDYKGVDTGSIRMARGGSWITTQGSMVISLRKTYDPNEKYNDIGFRIAKTN